MLRADVRNRGEASERLCRRDTGRREVAHLIKGDCTRTHSLDEWKNTVIGSYCPVFRVRSCTL